MVGAQAARTSAISSELLRAVQIEVPGRLGPEDGRYVVRDGAGEPAEVIVIATLGAGRARGRLRRGRPVPVDDPGATPVPVTRVTVVHPEAFEGREEALAWLQQASADPEAGTALLERTVLSLNRLLHVHRAAAQDPYIPELATGAATVQKLVVGSGDQLADGRWVEARELPAPRSLGRAAQLGDIRSQERIAAVLGGRERIDPCETLLLRARADFDQGRKREGAIQLGAAVDSLLSELEAGRRPGRRNEPIDREGESAGSAGEDATDRRNDDPDHLRDLGALQGAHDTVRSVAAKARKDLPSAEELDEVQGTLRVAERLLRRQRLSR